MTIALEKEMLIPASDQEQPLLEKTTGLLTNEKSKQTEYLQATSLLTIPVANTFTEIAQNKTPEAQLINEGASAFAVYEVARNIVATDILDETEKNGGIPRLVEGKKHLYQAVSERVNSELEKIGITPLVADAVQNADVAFGDSLAENGYEALEGPEELSLQVLDNAQGGYLALGVRKVQTLPYEARQYLHEGVENMLRNAANGETTPEEFIRGASVLIDQAFGQKNAAEIAPEQKTYLDALAQLRTSHPISTTKMSFDGGKTVIDAEEIENKLGLTHSGEIARLVVQKSAKSYADSRTGIGQQLVKAGKGVKNFYNANSDPDGPWRPDWGKLGLTALGATVLITTGCDNLDEPPTTPLASPLPTSTPDMVTAEATPTPRIGPASTSDMGTDVATPDMESWKLGDFDELGPHHYAEFTGFNGELVSPDAWKELVRFDEHYPDCQPFRCSALTADASNGEGRVGFAMQAPDGSLLMPMTSDGNIWSGQGAVDFERTEKISPIVTKDGETLKPTMFFDFNIGENGEVVAPNGKDPIDRLGWINQDGEVMALLIQPFTDGNAQLQIKEPVQMFGQDSPLIKEQTGKELVMTVDRFGNHYLGYYDVEASGELAGRIKLEAGPSDGNGEAGVWQLQNGEWVWVGEQVIAATETPPPTVQSATEEPTPSSEATVETVQGANWFETQLLNEGITAKVEAKSEKYPLTVIMAVDQRTLGNWYLDIDTQDEEERVVESVLYTMYERTNINNPLIGNSPSDWSLADHDARIKEIGGVEVLLQGRFQDFLADLESSEKFPKMKDVNIYDIEAGEFIYYPEMEVKRVVAYGTSQDSQVAGSESFIGFEPRYQQGSGLSMPYFDWAYDKNTGTVYVIEQFPFWVINQLQHPGTGEYVSSTLSPINYLFSTPYSGWGSQGVQQSDGKIYYGNVWRMNFINRAVLEARLDRELEGWDQYPIDEEFLDHQETSD